MLSLPASPARRPRRLGASACAAFERCRLVHCTTDQRLTPKARAACACFIADQLFGFIAAVAYRGDGAFLDTKSGLHKWTNCSMVTAAMPIQRSRSHETVTQEPLIEV